MKPISHLKSLETAAFEREIRIAEMNSRICELQAELLTRERSLAVIQAELIQSDAALVEARRTLAGKILGKHAERRRFTDSPWWKVTAVVRAPSSVVTSLRRGHVRDLAAALESLVRSRDIQIEGLAAHAAALADLAARKDQLLSDLATQASRRRLEIAALDRNIEDETRACDAMLSELANSTSWRLTAPARAAAAAFAWWRRDIGERGAARREKRRGSCRIEAKHHLTANPDGSFTSTGEDPQFIVRPASGELPRGWVEISFDVDETNEPLRPTLYAATDPSFAKVVELSLDAVSVGEARQIVRIPNDAKVLRFDPTNREGTFRISDLRLRKVGRRKALAELLERSPESAAMTRSNIKRHGFEKIWDEVFLHNNTKKHAQYSSWLEDCERINDVELAKIRAHSERLARKPLISVVMPTYNTNPEFLAEAIESVISQVYTNWELCIADDASTKPDVKAVLDKYSERDSRIKVIFRPVNGHISLASNSALELASGEFTALMDHDDLIPPHALYMVAVELNEHPDADLIYSDEDKITERGVRYEPYFKCDWNFELFCSMNMISHLGVYRTSLLREVGGFRAGYEGSQDYDIALRVVAKTTPERIRHIPHVLYHWRVFQTSGSYSTDFLDKAIDSSRRALADYFESIGEKVEITTGFGSANRVLRPLPSPAPLVSLLIPTRDRVDLLRGCVEGLLHRTGYTNIEILILDNESREPETLEYFKSLAGDERVRILNCTGPFNFSAINNLGVENARGDIIGFINNDIEVIGPEWLREMVIQALRPNVGAVGAKLLYADGTLQHGGVIVGLGGIACHSHKHLRGTAAGYFCRAQVPQYLSAVTAACLLMRRECFDEVGGYDEVNLAVAFNDVDLCLKVRAAGYDIVWTPHAELYHLESASRGDDMAPEKAARFAAEINHMRARWGDVLDNDPYYSPNLTLGSEDFAYGFPSRARRPWLEG